MKTYKFFLFLIAFSLLISCSKPLDYSSVLVIEVIDGDTIKLESGQLLRYIGIDTPESRIKRNNKFVLDPQPYSEEATQFNRDLVQDKKIRVEFDLVKKDRYNRLLGYCFVDDIFINAKLLEEGFATLYTYPPNIKYTDLFVKMQKQARQRKKGLWASYEVITAEVADQHIDQIRSVRGKVLNTYQSKKCVYLNFGENYKTDFTIVIFNNVLGLFKDQGIDPKTFYKHKTVEVTGRVREYNGPEIIVNSPFEIDIVQ